MVKTSRPSGRLEQAIPAGFARHQVAGEPRPTTLIAQRDLLGLLIDAGLERPWQIVTSSVGMGRGPRARLELADGSKLFVKQCLRGGAVANLNRERYRSAKRFINELEVSQRALAAGCPVAETLAVVLQRMRVGWRAWSVTRVIEQAHDLTHWVPKLERESIRTLLTEVSKLMQILAEKGLHHRDLNLGNIVARRGSDSWQLFAIDLDRARFLSRPLSQRTRQSIEQRFLRSWNKLFPGAPIETAAVESIIARQKKS